MTRGPYKNNRLVGQRFGRLLVIGPTEQRKANYVVWRCHCDCGAEALASTNDLRKGDNKSCGCLRREVAANFGLAGKAAAALVSDEARAERKKECFKVYAAELRDWYVAGRISRGSGLRVKDIPAELIELKREQLRLHRLAKEMSQAIEDRKETET